MNKRRGRYGSIPTDIVIADMDIPEFFFGKGDAYSLIWRLWHTHRSLLTGSWETLFSTRMQFFPFGSPMPIDTPIVNSILTLPAHIFWGPIGAYNTLVLFTFITSLIGFGLFFALLTRNKPAAFLASFALTFGSFRISHLRAGHADVLSSEWIGFLLYFAHQRFFLGKSRWHLLGMILMVALQAYTDYRVFFLVVCFVGLLFSVSLIRALASRSMRHIRTVGVDLMLATIVLTITLLPLVLLHGRTITSGYSPDASAMEDIIQSSATIDSYIIPSQTVKSAFLGYPLIALMILAILWPKKSTGERTYLSFWCIVMLIFFLLSLGPVIRWQGIPLLSPPATPYSWLMMMPFVRMFHVPEYFVLWVHIAVSAVSAYAVARLFGLLKRPALIFLFTILFIPASLLSVPSYRNFPIRNFDNDTVIISAIHNGPEGTVLSIPFGYFDSFRLLSPFEEQHKLLYQTAFGKPLMGGYMTYLDDNLIRIYRSDPIIRRILLCQEKRICPVFSMEEKIAFRTRFGVRYILFFDVDSFRDMRTMFRSSFPDSQLIRFGNQLLFILD